MYHCLQRKPVNCQRRLINSVCTISISRNVDKACLLSACVRVWERVQCNFQFDKSATRNQENAVNDHDTFRCVCFDISNSKAGHCLVKFLLSFSVLICVAILFIADIIRHLYNSGKKFWILRNRKVKLAEEIDKKRRDISF